MAKTVIILLIIVLGLAALIFFLPAGQVREETPDRAPDFSLRDYDGAPVSLSDFTGTPLVINSWAAWCPFCVEEMPYFAQAQEEFGDKVKIILINRAESLAVAKKFSDEVGVTGRLILLLDPEDSFYRSIGGFSMPETIFVDKNGDIVIHKRGPMDLAEIIDKTQQIISK